MRLAKEVLEESKKQDLVQVERKIEGAVSVGYTKVTCAIYHSESIVKLEKLGYKVEPAYSGGTNWYSISWGD